MEKLKWLILVFLMRGSAVAFPCDECDPGNCPTATTELPTDRRCRCDFRCGTYGDCCAGGPPPACGSGERGERLEGLQCRRTENIFLDNYLPLSVGERAAYWMVSACPDSWLATSTSSEPAAVQSNCTSGTDLLPPVSDNATGIVYRNEYCAVCNWVESAVRWRYGLGCTSWLHREMHRAELELIIFELTVEVINRECLICSYEPPLDASLEAKARACYPNDVNSCLPPESVSPLIDYELAAELCVSGQFNPVWADPVQGMVYRNQYCAQCNNETLTTCATLPGELFPVQLMPPPISGSYCADEAENKLSGQIRPPSVCTNKTGDTGIPSFPFSAVLDVGNDGVQVTISSTQTTLEVQCGEIEVYDPALEGCRPVVCTEIFQSGRGGCTFPSNANISCAEVLIQLTEDDDFQFVNNTTVLYSDALHNVVGMLDGSPVICINFSSNGTSLVNKTEIFYSYPTAYFVFTYIGCSLSLVGVTIILLSLAMFKELRTLSRAILANLSASMLVTNLFILVGAPVVEATQSRSLCISVSVVLHLFFLAQFSWMSTMSIEILRTLMRGVQLRTSPSRKSNQLTFIVYFLVGWGLPISIVGVTAAVNFSQSTSHLVLYGRLEDGKDGLCWMNHKVSAIIAFIVPITLSLLINLIILVIISVILIRAVRNQISINHSAPYVYVRVYCAVFFSSGITWVFGFLAIIAGTDWAWYPFIVFNSVQGFLLFVVFILTKKVCVSYLFMVSCGRLDYQLSTMSGGTGKATSSSSNANSSLSAVNKIRLRLNI